jgi:hypothetical protein
MKRVVVIGILWFSITSFTAHAQVMSGMMHQHMAGDASGSGETKDRLGRMAVQLKGGQVPSDQQRQMGLELEQLVGALPQTKQQQVHQMGPNVIPFEMGRTQHVFKMTETGGVQQVIVRNEGDKDQVQLIQQHLQQEADKFQNGDYSDPAALHGSDMPGLKELQAGARLIKITYMPLANGGEINFWTNDFRMMVALHRWFGAQLSEHCADAIAQ